MSAITPRGLVPSLSTAIAPPAGDRHAPSQSAIPLKVHYVRPNSASYGTSLPLLYGATRVSPTILWVGDWSKTVIIEPTTGVGTTKTNKWSVSLVLGLCEGPIAGLGAVWYQNQIKQPPIWVSTHFVTFLGTPTDQPWAYLTTNHPHEAIAYRDIAHTCVAGLDAGTTQQVPQLNIEVLGAKIYGGGILDAEPSDVIVDFLTNPLHGAGFPLAALDVAGTFQQFRTANIAIGIFISPLYDSQLAAADAIRQILEICVAGAVWSDGMLKIVPFYDQQTFGNSTLFTPQLNPVVPSSGLDDYVVHKAAEPVSMVRALPSDAFNDIRIEYVSRAHSYQVETAYARSQADIDVYTKRTAQPRQYHAITTSLTALKVARMQLQRGLTVRNQYYFTLDQSYIWLDPLDIWPLTSSDMGLLNYPVRIVSIELNANEDLVVVAEDLGVCNATGLLGGEPHGAGQNPIVNPASLQSINPPIFVEMTPEMHMHQLHLLIGVSGALGNLNWGGAEIWWSEDQQSWTKLGRVHQPAITGTLLADLPTYNGIEPDSTNTLQVDLSESAGVVRTTFQSQSLTHHNLAVVCGADYSNPEFFSITTVASLAIPFQFALTTLYRGLFGTPTSLHPAGSRFMYLSYTSRFDTGVFNWHYPARLIGSTIYFKFLSVDASDLTIQDINDSSVAVYPYQIQGDGVTKSVELTSGVFTSGPTVVLATLAAFQPPAGQQSFIYAFGTFTVPNSPGPGANGQFVITEVSTNTILTSQLVSPLYPNGTFSVNLGLQLVQKLHSESYQLKMQLSGGSFNVIILDIIFGIVAISANIHQG